MEVIANICVGLMFACIAFLVLVLIARPVINKIRLKREAKKNEKR